MKQLLIANERVILDDSQYFPFTHELSDLENINILKMPSSKTVTIPRCPQNDRIFGYIGEITRINLGTEDNQVGVLFNQTKKCEYILLDDSEQLSKGLVLIDNITENYYEITLYDYLIKKLEELEGDEESQEYYLSNCPIIGNNGSETNIASSALTVKGLTQSSLYGMTPTFNIKESDELDNNTLMCRLYDGTNNVAGISNLPTELNSLQLRTYKNWEVDWAMSIKNVMKSINAKYADTITYDSSLDDLFNKVHILADKPTTNDVAVESFISSDYIIANPEEVKLAGLTTKLKDKTTLEYICTDGGHKYLQLYYKFEFTSINKNSNYISTIYDSINGVTYYDASTPDGTIVSKIILKISLKSQSGLRTAPTYIQIDVIKGVNFTYTVDENGYLQTGAVEGVCILDTDFYPKFISAPCEYTDLIMELCYSNSYHNFGFVVPGSETTTYQLFSDGYVSRIDLLSDDTHISSLLETNLEFRTGDVVNGYNLYPKVSIKDFIIEVVKFFNLNLEVKDDKLHINRKVYYLDEDNDLLITSIDGMEVNNISFNKLRLVNSLPKSDILDSYKSKYKKTYGCQIVNTGYSIKNNVKEITSNVAIPMLLRDFNSYGYDRFLSRFNGGYSKFNHGVVTDLTGKLTFGYLNYVEDVMYVTDDNRFEGKMIYDGVDVAPPTFNYGGFCEAIPFPPTEVNFTHTNMAITCDTRLDEWDPNRFTYNGVYDSGTVLYGGAKLKGYYTFSPYRFTDGIVTSSLEFGKSEVSYCRLDDTTYPETSTLYHKFHRNMITDKYNSNTHILSVRAYVDKPLDVNKIYNYKNSFYIISSIVEYDPTQPGIYELKLMRVNNPNNYINNLVNV